MQAPDDTKFVFICIRMRYSDEFSYGNCQRVLFLILVSQSCLGFLICFQNLKES